MEQKGSSDWQRARPNLAALLEVKANAGGEADAAEGVEVEVDRWPPPSTAGRRGCRGCLVAILIIVAVLIFGAWRVLDGLSLGGSYEPVISPVRSTSQEIVLTASKPVVTGDVTVRFGAADSYWGLVIGVSLGLPQLVSEVPSTQQQDLFSDPLVRLSVPQERFAQPCGGPCEIALSRGDCQTACVLVYPIRLELVSIAPEGARIKATVSAAAGTALEGRLPSGLSVELRFDPPVGAEGS